MLLPQQLAMTSVNKPRQLALRGIYYVFKQDLRSILVTKVLITFLQQAYNGRPQLMPYLKASMHLTQARGGLLAGTSSVQACICI